MIFKMVLIGSCRLVFFAIILALFALSFNLGLCSEPQISNDFIRVYKNDYENEDSDKVCFRLEVLNAEDNQHICTHCGCSKLATAKINTEVPKCSRPKFDHTGCANITEEIEKNPVVMNLLARMKNSIKLLLKKIKKSLHLPMFAQKIATLAGVVLVSEVINALLPVVSFEVPYSLNFGCNGNGAHSISVSLA